ncbi:hypothetical protein BDW62DRAFT_186991 [Aspergillus aurantiobrunneus]
MYNAQNECIGIPSRLYKEPLAHFVYASMPATMDTKYNLLEDLSYDVGLSIKDFLDPAGVENLLNTSPNVWSSIFKDTSWLEFALNFDQCAPYFLGHQLSTFCRKKSSNDIYLALIVKNFSGGSPVSPREAFWYSSAWVDI